ncbi:unnamed protein product [Debaryomyces fabryi]|nr:unnamed protein product [Debaryomyces fabryi]
MLEDHIDNEQDQKVMEFDIPLPLNEIRPSSNLMKRHTKIAILLGLPEDDIQIQHLFSTVATICDPFTQPEETEKSVLSLDCLSDVLIALSYTYFKNHESDEENESLRDPDIQSVKFALSAQFFTLLRYIQALLNADDEIQLRYVKNSEDVWLKNLPIWTPKEAIMSDEFALKLCYSISCVLLFSINKLFKPENNEQEYNVALNPYLQYFIKLWKCHTNIILLGLEIDRRLELEQAQCPYMITRTLKGSSSIRYVLAWSLNQNPSLLAFHGFETPSPEANKSYFGGLYDIKYSSLLNFTQPMSRKKINGGALLIDMRLVVVALLIINSGISFTARQEKSDDLALVAAERISNQSTPIAELGDLLIDLEYDDQFDEDIRYIFECEYDEVEEEWLGVVEEEEAKKFQNKEEISNPPKLNEKERKMSNAVRTKDDIDFDEFGNDWRDLPRGDNVYFQDWFIDMVNAFDNLPESQKGNSDDILYCWSELKESFDFLTTTSIEGDSDAEEKFGQVVINTVSKAIKDESDDKINDPALANTPDVIYQYFCELASEEDIQNTQNNNRLIVPIFNITKFELLLHNNSKLARCLMDEMLMCKGYRRVLIWFITHDVNLSTLLIDYIFELLAGLRGNDEKQRPYKHTRKGQKVELSEVERLMLLHEFLTNSGIYLSATEGIEIDNGYKVVLSESIAKKYMTLICLMINQLINIGIINLDRKSITNKAEGEEDIHDYSTDLQVLLIQWIGKLPEARELFFKIKKANYNDDAIDTDNVTAEVPTLSTNDADDHQNVSNLLERYREMTSDQINEDLGKDLANIAMLVAIIDRLEKHVKTVIATQLREVSLLDENMISTDLDQMSSDFNLFLQNFNTFCKIDFFAEELFGILENLATTGSFIEKIPMLTEFDSEFNELFLNGEGKFNDKKEDENESKSSKKKKKKKKKKKVQVHIW